MQRRILVVTLLAAVSMAALGSWWLCNRSESIAFLPASPGAEWIIQPKSPETAIHPDYPVEATFKRTFILAAQPATASLAVRAFRSAAITVNGHPASIGESAGQNWKLPAMVPVAGLLRAGTNEITVFVTNNIGPPALWLRLQCGPISVGSDASWLVSFAGTFWQNAGCARQPPVIEPSSVIYGGERIPDSLKRVWPELVLFCVVSLIMVCTANWWLGRRHQPTPIFSSVTAAKLLYGLFIVLVIARIALFVNNAPQIPRLLGFDAAAHEQYVRFIQEKHALPLPNDGWEMHQPPLYYLISANVLDTCGLSVSDDDAGLVLRAVNGVVGLIQCWLALLCLRRLFPMNLSAQAVGLLVAGFVPAHLYLSDYVTNEPLAGLFITLAFYLLIRALSAEKESLRLHIVIGMVLGAALLTKLSILLALPLFPAALGLRLLAQKNYSRRDWLRSVGAVVLSCLVVCGWHYALVWAQIGKLPLPNWETDPAHAWWQDPGFRTGAYYFSFGQVLVSPLFSAFHAFGDGIYSTLWGDGLISGSGTLSFRPPWNYDLMNAGYVLSLGISLLFMAGFVVSLWQFIRQPKLEWFVLLGLVGMFMLGIIYLSLRSPWLAHVKAFYALPALVPFSALIAAGWNWLAQKSRLLRTALWVLVWVWTLTVYTTFWIRSGNFETCRVRATYEMEQQNYTGAADSLARALELKPDDAQTHYLLAETLKDQNSVAEAILHYREALRLNPDLVPAMDDLAWLIATCPDANIRDGTQSVQLAERACELTHYQNATMIETLAAAYAEAGRFGEAAVTAEKAHDLAQALGQQELALKCQELLQLFKNHQPCRETVGGQ